MLNEAQLHSTSPKSPIKTIKTIKLNLVSHSSFFTKFPAKLANRQPPPPPQPPFLPYSRPAGQHVRYSPLCRGLVLAALFSASTQRHREAFILFIHQVNFFFTNVSSSSPEASSPFHLSSLFAGFL